MEFILVRHAETINNIEHRFNGWCESPLTERGVQMRDRMIEKLILMHRRKPFAQIFASPTLRAKEMAEDLSARIQLPVTIDPVLREFNFGPFDGLTAKEAAEHDPALWRQWMADYAKAELSEYGNFTCFHDNLGEWLKTFEMSSNERVVIFSHGGTINSLLLHLMGLPMDERWRFAIDPGGMAVIDAPDGYGFLRTLYSPNIEEF